MSSPPPVFQPRLFSPSSNTPLNSASVLMSPSPTVPYGWTGPNFGASMKLPITVMTLESLPGVSPKKSGICANSSSNPNSPPNAPTDTPQLRFLSSQLLTSGQPESPPKLYPRVAPTKPCAAAGAAPANEIVSVKIRVETNVRAVGDIAQSPRDVQRCKNQSRGRRMIVGEARVGEASGALNRIMRGGDLWEPPLDELGHVLNHGYGDSIIRTVRPWPRPSVADGLESRGQP